MTKVVGLSDSEQKEAARLLKVLSHPVRLRLALHLLAGEFSVAEMERELGVHQPNLSQQLGELREARLVSTRRAHKLVFYRLTDTRAANLLARLPAILRSHPSPQPDPAVSLESGGAAVFAVVEKHH
jgi:DNA-binding transcriptional ArsR family regulator